MSDPGDSRIVLYVEDEQFDRVFMQLAFEKRGLAPILRVVNQGRDAIGYLSGEGGFADRSRYPLPSLMLLDLKLGPFSGFEVLEWAAVRPPSVPYHRDFLLVGAAGGQAQAASLGVSGLLRKAVLRLEVRGRGKNFARTAGPVSLGNQANRRFPTNPQRFNITIAGPSGHP